LETKQIKVDTWTLSELIVDVERGKLRIPQFQRDFVWEKPRVIKLLDSIYSDFPIGSFFFWIAPKEYHLIYRDIPDLRVKHYDDTQDVTFILDGQQRITSIYAVIKGLLIKNKNYYDICFDLDKEVFVARKGDHIRFIPLADFFSNDFLKIFNGLNDDRKKNFQRCLDRFKNYPFSIIIVKEKNIEQVCEIFERLNQGGKKLDLVDLVVANTWDENFKLKDKINELNTIFLGSFGEIKEEVFIQSVALIRKRQCNRAYQLKLTTTDFSESWEKFSEALKKAVDFIINNLGVKTVDILPYPSMLPPIAYFFYFSKTMSNYQKEKVEEWFWKCSFSERYSSSTLTKMGEDRNIFDKILQKEKVFINYFIKIDNEKIKKISITGRSAIRNAILCILANKNPRSFKDNSAIILDKHYFSNLNSSEKHHIFPKHFLESIGKKGFENSILNFCFISSMLNKEISKKKPSVYFSEYRKSNKKFEDVLKIHLISPNQDSAIWSNDYDLFMNQRAELISKEIKKLVGELTDIEKELEENPVAVLGDIENKIRERLHIELYEYYGENYWGQHIPPDIQDQIERRFKELLKKQPFLKDEYEQPQKKLLFCDIMDYSKIILKNWKVFEDIFASKEQLEKHFKNLKEFRNVLAHSKQMNSITKKEGEVALEWLSKVLNYEEIVNENEESKIEEENELYKILENNIQSLDKNITMEPQKHYIAFKIGGKNLVSVQKRKDKLLLYLRGSDFNDPNQLIRDMSGLGHRGSGKSEITLISISDLVDVMKLVKQAYMKIKK